MRTAFYVRFHLARNRLVHERGPFRTPVGHTFEVATGDVVTIAIQNPAHGEKSEEEGAR